MPEEVIIPEIDQFKKYIKEATDNIEKINKDFNSVPNDKIERDLEALIEMSKALDEKLRRYKL